MSQLILAACPVDSKTPCPVERTMILRDDLPYFCVFCQIRKRLEKTAEADDWISWDRYVYRNTKQTRLPRGWKKLSLARPKAKQKVKTKPKVKPRHEARKTGKRKVKSKKSRT